MDFKILPGAGWDPPGNYLYLGCQIELSYCFSKKALYSRVGKKSHPTIKRKQKKLDLEVGENLIQMRAESCVKSGVK